MSGQPASAYNQFDFIVVHARSAFTAPAKPSWDDVQPILTQFNNLYPIMSQKLFDMADPDEVKRNVHLLRLAFGLDISDPNYMPVTRDLSEPKRQMIRAFLDQLAAQEVAIPQQEARQQPAAPMVAPCGGCAAGAGARAGRWQDAIRPHAADQAQVVLNKPHWGAPC